MSIFDKGAVPIHGVSRAYAKGAAFTIDIPQGAVIEKIYIRNKTANAVTGGVKVGTTLGGTDVLAAGAVAASALVSYPALIGGANTAAVRTLYFDAVTAWNAGSVDVAVSYTDLV